MESYTCTALWLFPLSMILRFILIVECVNSCSFFLIVGWYFLLHGILLYEYITICYPFTCWWYLYCFQFGVILNKSVNILIHIFLWAYIFTLLLLLLSHFSRVQLCAAPQTAAHQAPWSPGFSRQEHWSGLPFPSSMHEREKWKWSRSVVFDS